ncbi:MAG: N-6 DNA methylase [Anaerolineales bacterium]|nr:N-6 DNA methylase [Anaerolineales bacterium]
MTYTFDQSKDEIARLVRHFSTNRAAFLAAGYKEAQSRQEFIDPLFIALNWDVRNRQQAAPDYREVVVEDSLAMGRDEARKAPDYVFRIGRDRKFFAEAKKPGVDLKTAISPAYQLRRYAWSAKLPLSVLTDFQEWAAYDCRIRPSDKDKSSAARLTYITYEEYADRWHEIWDVFSREAVWGGSFDQFAQSGKGRRGTSEVDAEFLKEIEGWRDSLARNIAVRNPDLTLDEMNDAVQRTIDRIIFLRMAEARGMEEYGELQRIGEGGDIFSGLLALSKKADARYNSGLFNFSKSGDLVTPRLTVDDKALKPILADLYFPQSPYEFSVLPVEILGNVYEQFLGKVIRLTAAHQAKVEEKPEVKKAGGVYYTPAYIVNYIVQNTVGRQIEGKTPAQLKGFRVLDPACGSGSFLVGAYTHLLDYYRDWYNAHEPGKHKEAIAQQADGSWQLTLSERKRILTEHIFGVDIDRQAVEVTKLSLLLKVLEGLKQLSLFEERALPNLDKNIKCGNSLIGPDYFAGQMMPDSDELKRVNPFDWKQGFPEAMQAGGFDCVIGNPPYIFTRELIKEYEKDYYNRLFKQTQFKINTYLLFVEKGFSLLKGTGRLGFIIPNNWLTLETASQFRHFILTETYSALIVNSRDRVFEHASVDTSILIFSKTGPSEVTICELENGDIKPIEKKESDVYLNFHNHIISYAAHKSDQNIALCQKITSLSILLEVIAEVRNGIQAYTVGEGIPTQTEQMKNSRVYHSSKKEDNTWKKYVDGADVDRYQIGWSKQFVKYGRNLSRPRKNEFFKGERLLIRQIPAKPPYSILTSYVNEDLVNDNNSMIVTQPKAGYNLKYLMGILNSRLITFWFIQAFGKLQRKVFPQFKIKELRIFPIRPIDFTNQVDNSFHDLMVKLVDKNLDAHKRKTEAKDASELDRLQRVIDSTDQQIDQLVYELYELTPEEIAIVEQATQSKGKDRQ